MLYTILKPIVSVILRIYFRKIHIIGLEHIPKDRPLLIASNHPTGFLEPCIMACFFPISLHFLTRGDLFRKPIMNFILRSTHQIPIYRFKDGFNAMRKNKNQMEAVMQALYSYKSIVVFIEGSTSTVRKLRKFQKGLAKMLTSFLRDHKDVPIAVLPVAVNFSNANKFRSSVSIQVYPIVEPAQYDLLSEEKSVKEINRLTEDLYTIMKPGVFHTNEDIADEKYNAQLNQFLYDSFPKFFPHIDKDEKMRDRGKFLETNFDPNLATEEVGAKYWKVESWSLRKPMQILLSPFALIGYLLNFPPNQMSKWVTKKKVKLEAFVAPVLIASNLCFYLAYFTLILIIGLTCNYYILSMLILVPLGGYIYLYHLHLKENFEVQRQWSDMSKGLKEKVLAFKHKLP